MGDILKSDLFPYLEGIHLFNKKDQDLTIARVKQIKLPKFDGQGDITREVVYFVETDKGFVLSAKCNVKLLVSLLGRETDDWKGKKIRLGHEWVKCFGKTVHAIRVRDVQLNGQNGPNNSPPMTRKDAIQGMIDTEPEPSEAAYDPQYDAAKNG